MTEPWPRPTDPHDAFRRPSAGGSASEPWAGRAASWAAPVARPLADPCAHDAMPVTVTALGAPSRAPRRRHGLLFRLVRTLLLLGLVGFVALIALGWWASRHLDVVVPAAPPTVAAPQQTSTATASSTPAPPGDYANDAYVVPPVDRNPPALPEPDTYEEATGLMKANRLYQQAVPVPTRCEMAPIDLEKASRPVLTAHLNEMMGCLMRVWAPPLTAAGYTPVRPSVTVYSGSVSTRCGRMRSMNASYCGADQQVYYAVDLPRVVPASLRRSPFVVESVLAHEFGHAVQARSGILVSEQAWEDKSHDEAVRLQLSRRLEQQADCFAGQFIGSVAQSTRLTPDQMGRVGQLFGAIGDDVLSGVPSAAGNHGSGRDRRAWATAGAASARISTCNTFTAPASAVR